ncbi:MAG: hypothetical protein FH752_17835 [Marinobacter adhaerens]|uniref:Uncharacterized protein n=1 Tax=Marinobacter adhaerens TaxID=1033846 RepID=A0A844I880_9GAMM|nr:hypothetical protein [Marinobacter adhaerens]
MEIKIFGISLAIGIGLAAVFWLPVLWGYLFAKWKGLVSPKRFAFFSGCTSYGIQTLIGALLIFPFAVPATKSAPQYCYDKPGAWLCHFLDFAEDWSGAFGLIAAVAVTVVAPAIFNKYVWAGTNSR